MKKFYRKRGGYVPFIPKNKTRTKNAPFGVQAPRTYTRPNTARNFLSNASTGLYTETRRKNRMASSPAPQTQTQEQEMRRRRRLKPRVTTIGRRRPRYDRKKKDENNLVEKVRMTGQGSTSSYFRKYARRMNFRRRVETVSPEQYRLRTTGIRLDGSYGKQCSTYFVGMTSTDLTNVLNNVPGYNDNTRLLFKNYKSELLFTNQSKTNVFLDLYECRYRKSTNSHPRALVDNGLADYGAAGLNLDTYGITPFKSKLFTTMVKVDKIYRLELGCGRTHRHISNWSYNKEFCGQEVSIQGMTLDFNEDWTRFIYIIARGEPVNDVTTKTSATVTPSSLAVDFVWKEEIKYHYGNPSGSTFELSNSLPSTGVTQNVMDEASGAAEAQETA